MMQIRWILRFVAVMGLGVLCGCASDRAGKESVVKQPKPGGQELIVTPQEILHGRVSSVNSSLRFVVITFPVGKMAGLGQPLNVYRGGLKVAEIRVTGPQREDSTVADIVTGDAAVGDEVRDR